MTDAIIQIAVSACLAAVLSSTLAVLLLVAEKRLTNYGRCAIDINDGGRTLDVRGGGNLLMTLKNAGIFVPSACGGRGTCAYCKVKILDGAGPVGPTETPLLSEQEIKDNVRISCQCKVRNDLKVEIPEELLSVREFLGVVEKIADLTHDTKELRIRLIEPAEIKFTAGQYVQLEAPPYGGSRESVFRAYSISSVPSDTGRLELVVRLVPGGICTTWVFEHLKEDEEVTFTGPFGDFHLSDTDSEMVWIAGGSGMAPFWSMVRHMKEQGVGRKCTYFFGAVRRRDLFYVDELTKLSTELDWFEFVPALSAPEADTEWTGETGLITEVVDRRVASADGCEAYLCGSPGMIDAAVKVLKDKGFTPDRIFFDKFA
jgi:Na+-transporting NADH:ubiquinone oxidoreductase subunit F